MAGSNFYEILGLDRDVTPEVIRAAYERLAHRYRRDASAESVAKVAEIDLAYQTLINPTRRARYDRSLTRTPRETVAPTDGNAPDIPADRHRALPPAVVPPGPTIEVGMPAPTVARPDAKSTPQHPTLSPLESRVPQSGPGLARRHAPLVLVALGAVVGAALAIAIGAGVVLVVSRDTDQGSDEKFVGDICKAGLNFTKALEEVFKDPAALADEDKAIEKLADAFEDFSNAFAKSNPPADLKAWHSDASKQLKEGVKQIKDGDLEGGIFAGDSPFPEPPADAGDRLSKVAESNEDCIEADFAFTD